MAKTKILLAIALDYFTRYTESNECHITSDERVFHQKSTADSFALSLENQEVASYTRDEVIGSTDVIVNDGTTDSEKGTVDPGTDTADDDKGTGAADAGTKTASEAEPITLDQFNDKTEYPQAKELFKSLGLKAPSNSKKDIFAALTAAQTAANTKE